jgi:hypothetical protein
LQEVIIPSIPTKKQALEKLTSTMKQDERTAPGLYRNKKGPPRRAALPFNEPLK